MLGVEKLEQWICQKVKKVSEYIVSFRQNTRTWWMDTAQWHSLPLCIVSDNKNVLG